LNLKRIILAHHFGLHASEEFSFSWITLKLPSAVTESGNKIDQIVPMRRIAGWSVDRVQRRSVCEPGVDSKFAGMRIKHFFILITRFESKTKDINRLMV